MSDAQNPSAQPPAGAESDAEIPSAQQKAEAEEELPLPPPSFEYLTISLRMQAEAYLGLVHFGEEKPPKPDLRAARHAIDMLAMLEQKTRGNLSLEQQRLLANSLTELRFRYVQALEESRKKE